MDTENIAIFEKDILFAQKLCASIEDKDKRNRAVANILGARLVESFFDPSVYQVDIESGLHNVSAVLENYEISDIYINNSYVDVRVYFDDDEICVPKSHFDTGILPVAYMFVRISKDLTQAAIEGFIHPERVDQTKLSDEMYYVSLHELENFYDIESRLQKQLDTGSIPDEQIFGFLDGSMSGDEVVPFLSDLVKSKSARLKLIKYLKAQSVFNLVSVPQVQSTEVPTEETASEGQYDNAEVQEQADEELQEISEEADITEDDLDSLFESENTEYSTAITPSGADVIESLNNNENENTEGNSEQIETLFTGEQEGVPVSKPKKHSGGFLALLVLILLAAGGYIFYSNVMVKTADNNIDEIQESVPDAGEETVAEESVEPAQAEEAMPVETVENKTPTVVNEENSSTAIPAIEKSLDASVLVSNLKIDWEVPEGYASNTAAKRYLVKLGKVIQLDLKTELLLLQKPPLSNKITVELKYNQNLKRFETAGIRDSSGEKSVDDLILNTVNGVLKMSVSPNMDSIAKLQGSPVLIIHL